MEMNIPYLYIEVQRFTSHYFKMAKKYDFYQQIY